MLATCNQVSLEIILTFHPVTLIHDQHMHGCSLCGPRGKLLRLSTSHLNMAMASEMHIVPRCHSQDTPPIQHNKAIRHLDVPIVFMLQSHCSKLTQFHRELKLRHNSSHHWSDLSENAQNTLSKAVDLEHLISLNCLYHFESNTF